MKINSTTILLAIGTAMLAGADNVTSATAWADLLRPLPVFSILGPAIMTAAAHVISTPKATAVRKARELLDLTRKEGK